MGDAMFCDDCGVIVTIEDIENETAFRILATPDSAFTSETYITLCEKCYIDDTFAEWCDDEELNT